MRIVIAFAMTEEPMIALYMKNRPWPGEPHCDYIRVLSEEPLRIVGFRMDGIRLKKEPLPETYLKQYAGWYHPATCWEIEQYRRLLGSAREAS
jgi:hypothetical protein